VRYAGTPGACRLDRAAKSKAQGGSVDAKHLLLTLVWARITVTDYRLRPARAHSRRSVRAMGPVRPTHESRTTCDLSANWEFGREASPHFAACGVQGAQAASGPGGDAVLLIRWVPWLSIVTRGVLLADLTVHS